MDSEFPIHPLETFPRQELSVRITRRKFFTIIAKEFNLWAGQSDGVNAIKIPTLGTMSDDQLRDFIPAILPGCNIEIRDGDVWGKLENWSNANFLFTMDRLSCFCFNHTNGKNSLMEIARFIEGEFGFPFERGFAITRGMFLTLVRAGVCLPLNNPLLG